MNSGQIILQNWLDLIYVVGYVVSGIMLFVGLVFFYRAISDWLLMLKPGGANQFASTTSVALNFITSGALMSLGTSLITIVDTTYVGTGFDFSGEANPANWRLSDAPSLNGASSEEAFKIMATNAVRLFGFFGAIAFFMTLPRLDRNHIEHRGATKDMVGYFIGSSIMLGAPMFSSWLPDYIGPLGEVIKNIFN